MVKEAFSEDGYKLGVQTMQAFVLDNKDHGVEF